MAEIGVQQRWQLDHDGARAYEQHLVPAVFDAWAADLVAAVDIRPGERVLDVGTGTGIAARHAAGRLGGEGAVTGVDVNPAMLAVAREEAAHRGLPIRLLEAPAEDLPFPEAAFDVVMCQQALQFFDDRAAAVAEIARVTRPGGRLGLSTCRAVAHQPGYAVLIDALTRHVGAHAATVTRSPYGFGHLDDMRALLNGADLRDVHLRIAVWPARFASAEALLRAETVSSPLGDLLERLHDDVRQRLLSELAAGLTAHTDDDGVSFPFETLVATATR